MSTCIRVEFPLEVFFPPEFGHLLEIYDFPKEFATQDLLMAFKDHQ